jgi:hypothetical protein
VAYKDNSLLLIPHTIMMLPKGKIERLGENNEHGSKK